MSAQLPPQQPASGEQKIVEAPKPSNRVYCRWEVTDDTLKEMFGKFGKVTESRVIRGPRLRAFGFVTFASEAEAAQAITALNGKGMMMSPMTVEYAGPERARPARRVPAETSGAAPAAAAQGAQPRRQRQPRGQQAAQLQAAAGQQQPPVEGAARARRRRPRRPIGSKSPDYGKVVTLIPDPIRTPIPPEHKIVELVAGPREYVPGVSAGKVVSSLILNADPTKGPFNCDFRLGEFDLKLLSVRVICKPDDCRVSARMMHVTTGKNHEVYLRVRSNPAENRNKFFELVKPGTDETAPHYEAFYVGVDSIQVDPETSLWKKIVLSLVSAVVPPRPVRPARVAGETSAAAPAPAQAAPARK